MYSEVALLQTLRNALKLSVERGFISKPNDKDYDNQSSSQHLGSRAEFGEQLASMADWSADWSLDTKTSVT